MSILHDVLRHPLLMTKTIAQRRTEYYIRLYQLIISHHKVQQQLGM